MNVGISVCVASCALAIASLPFDGKMEDAIRYGAMAKVVYRVVDDEFVPVSNAIAHVSFRSYGRHQDDADWCAFTDVNGMFVVEHRTNDSLDCGIDKGGYYHSHDRILFRDRPGLERMVEDGKWQPYGEVRTIILKRVKNPVELRGVKYASQRRYPEIGRWAGMDLERYDWCPPYGHGEHADVLIRFQRNSLDEGYEKVMDVCFTNNPYAGMYVMRKTGASDCPIGYFADTNAEYHAVMSYCVKKDKMTLVQKTLDRDHYLVYRTRTKVDDDGRLVEAHYGVLSGEWRFFEKGGMKINQVLFNPIPNDTNLEDVETMRRSRLRRAQNLEDRDVRTVR